MPGRTVTDTVALAAGDLTGAVQGFGHEDEVPLASAGLVDGILPELRGQALREVASQSVDADVRLVLRRGGRVAGFLEPVDRIMREVVPHLERGRGVSGEFIALEQEGELVGVVRILLLTLSVQERRSFLLHQRVVVPEVELTHVGPVSEVVPVGGNRDLCQRGRRGGREALLGVPAGVEGTDLLRAVYSDSEVYCALTHDGIR